MKKYLILFLLASILSAKEVYKQIRIYYQNQDQLFQLLQLGIDIDHSHGEKNEWIEFAIAESKLSTLNSNFFDYEIIHQNLEEFYLSRLEHDFESRDFELGSMGGYYTFDEIEEQLDKLHENFPNLITEKLSLGQTLEGRNVWMVKISDNPNLDESRELHAASAKIKGPVQKGTPILTFLVSKQQIPLIRNLNTIGASNSNDIVVESNEVASRHAKIYKVGQTWKIQNLHIHETTSVNGRRIDQRFLQDGDEVTIGDVLIRFNLSKTKFRQVPRQKIESAKQPQTT